MERKRCPTGTWAIENSSVRELPPPSPAALNQMHATFAQLVYQTGKVSVNQQAVASALATLNRGAAQTEQAVLQATGYYSDQVREVISAVKQGNLLHEQTNQLLRLTVDQLRECSGHWQALTAALDHNTRIRRQAQDSWLQRALVAFYQHRSTAAVGILAGAACCFAYSLAIYLTR